MPLSRHLARSGIPAVASPGARLIPLIDADLHLSWLGMLRTRLPVTAGGPRRLCLSDRRGADGQYLHDGFFLTQESHHEPHSGESVFRRLPARPGISPGTSVAWHYRRCRRCTLCSCRWFCWRIGAWPRQ